MSWGSIRFSSNETMIDLGDLSNPSARSRAKILERVLRSQGYRPKRKGWVLYLPGRLHGWDFHNDLSLAMEIASKGSRESRDPSQRRRKTSPLKAKLTPSPRLSPLTGSKKVTRAQAVKAVWRYIKRHRLQYESDGRKFRVQGLLRPLFPGKRANMFQVAKVVSRNLR